VAIRGRYGKLKSMTDRRVKGLPDADLLVDLLPDPGSALRADLVSNSGRCYASTSFLTTMPDFPLTQSPTYPITQLPDQPITQSPDHPITNHPLTQLPDQPSTQSPITQSPDHPITKYPLT
jgi:hypothetical protein